MSDQSHRQHGAVNQGGMLISRGQASPVSTFQTEVTFSPSEVPFNNGPGPAMELPLVNKEQRGQKAFTLTQIVIDVKAGLQHQAIIDQT